MNKMWGGVGVIGVWLMVLVTMLPLGNFAYEDDFAYLHTLWKTDATGMFGPSEWAFVPEIIQVWWTLPWVKLLGSQIWVTHFANWVLMGLGMMGWYIALRKTRVSTWQAVFFVGAGISFPRVINYYFSFMADGFYMSFTMIWLAVCVTAWQKNTRWWWLGVGGIAALAFGVRQTGVALGLAPIGVLLIKHRWREALWVAVPLVAAVGIYIVWIWQRGQTAGMALYGVSGLKEAVVDRTVGYMVVTFGCLVWVWLVVGRKWWSTRWLVVVGVSLSITILWRQVPYEMLRGLITGWDKWWPIVAGLGMWSGGWWWVMINRSKVDKEMVWTVVIALGGSVAMVAGFGYFYWRGYIMIWLPLVVYLLALGARNSKVREGRLVIVGGAVLVAALVVGHNHYQREAAVWKAAMQGVNLGVEPSEIDVPNWAWLGYWYFDQTFVDVVEKLGGDKYQLTDIHTWWGMSRNVKYQVVREGFDSTGTNLQVLAQDNYWVVVAHWPPIVWEKAVLVRK